MGLFDGAKEVRINNKVVKSIIGENNMTLYINGEISPSEKVTLTNLSSSTITYGTAIQLQATYILRDGEVSGQTVTLYDGSSVKTTGTTDSNGDVTFNVSNLSVGNHSFKVACGNVESAVVSVVVNKITPTLTLYGSNISYGQTLSLTGTLSVGSGKSVKIYNGNTLVDTVTTGSNGAFSKSVTGLNTGTHTFKAVYDGDGVTNSVTSANVNITVSKVNTNLVIDVPLNLTYSDAFNITGTLTGSNSNTIPNATVKLIVGNKVVDIQTTNNNGVATFTQTPVQRGTHTFYLLCPATANYNSSMSSTVTREINKETTVLTITSPTNNAEFYTADTIPVIGTLTTDDNETFTASIEVSDGDGNLIKTIQVNNGEINDSITAPSTSGNFSLIFTYVSTNLYTSSTVSRTVVIKDPTLSLTVDKPILSYADEESAVLTATYSGENLSGQSVVFKQGDTVLDTVTTNANGIATYTYDSKGVGDVTITVECMSLQETYTIEDCLNYDSLTSNSGKWTVPSGVTSQYSDNGWKVSANGYKQIKLTDKLTSACSVEFTVVDYGSSSMSSYPPVIIYAYTNGETTPNQPIITIWNSSSFNAVDQRINHALVKGAVYKIEYTSSTLKVYENGTLLATANNNVGFPTRFEFHMGTNSRNATYKDLKVKPL